MSITEETRQQAEHVRQELSDRGVRILYVNFIGPDGHIGSKCSLTGLEAVHIDDAFLDGIAVNGKLIRGWEHEDEAEWLLLRPELPTVRYPSWTGDHQTAYMMGSFVDFPLDGRACAKRVVDYAQSMGIAPMCGTSACFCLDDARLVKESEPYRLPLAGILADFNIEIATKLHEVGINVEYFQHLGGGYSAADLVPTTFLEALDQHATALWLIRSISMSHGFDIGFASPTGAIPLCDVPVHLSLWNAERDRNLFFDGSDALELSATGKHFIAGILHYFRELTAIIQLSAQSSYAQQWRCTYSASRDDSLVHVPVYLKERKKHDRVGWGKRILFNGFLASCNLHVCASAVMLAGLEGVRNRWNPDEQSDAALLAQAVGETSRASIETLASSNVFRDVLGDGIIDYLLERGRA